MQKLTKYEKKMMLLIVVIMATGFFAAHVLDGYYIRQDKKYEMNEKVVHVNIHTRPGEETL